MQTSMRFLDVIPWKWGFHRHNVLPQRLPCHTSPVKDKAASAKQKLANNYVLSMELPYAV
jgi:hypothetical protein